MVHTHTHIAFCALERAGKKCNRNRATATETTTNDQTKLGRGRGPWAGGVQAKINTRTSREPGGVGGQLACVIRTAPSSPGGKVSVPEEKKIR